MNNSDIVSLVVWIVVLIVFLVYAIFYLKRLRKEEDKTNKAKRTMYNAWYDLAILYADLKNKELENKEEKQENE